MKKSKTPQKNTTIDGLAVMVAEGFNAVHQEIGQVSSKMTTMQTDIDELKQGQEQIKLRLDNVAYRFEIVELQKRVDVLEKKVGIDR